MTVHNQQPETSKSKRISRVSYSVFAVLASIYTYLMVSAPIRSNNYHLSATAIRVLDATIILPIFIVWFLAIFAGVRFKQYALKLEGYDDALPSNTLADGLLTLGFGSILTSIFSLVRSYYALNSQAYQTLTVLSNYLSLALIGTVFVVVYIGSKELLALLKSSPAVALVRQRLVASMVSTGLAVVYTAAVFTDDYRTTTSNPLTHASFYLHDGALLFTMVLPTVIIWTIAGQAIINLYAYQKNVQGSTYRRIYKLLSIGLATVLAFYVLITMLTTLSGFLSGSSLAVVLAFLYIIIIAYGAGFVVIAQGARKLRRLEEV